MIQFTLDLEPVAKARARVTRKGAFTPAATRRFERAMYMLSRRHMPPAPLKGALKVDIVLYLKPPRRCRREYPSVRPDWDNFAKAICDSLNSEFRGKGKDRVLIKAGFWEDDGQIVDARTRKFYDWTNRRGRIEISIEELRA